MEENVAQMRPWYKVLMCLFISLPICNLVLNEIAWLHFGIDIPFWDDWGDYISGTVGSFKWSYLIATVNDTMSPVYKLLNSTVYYPYLNGNSVAYQFITKMVVLGSLLFLQWRLLCLALPNRLFVASAFSLTLLMLQPASYWGIQSSAYIQAVPLVCSLASMYFILREKNSRCSTIPILSILGFISGYSYISGAFATLVLSIIFIIVSKFIENDDRKVFFNGGLALLVPGVITVMSQMWVLIFVQHGVHTGKPMTFPIESDFWIYFLGKIARSAMLPIDHPITSITVTSVLILFILMSLSWSLGFLIMNKKYTLSEARLFIVFISMFGVIFVYLLLVAAGRANLRYDPGASTLIEMFSYAATSYHYFWLTLIWPWVFAIFLMKLNNFSFIKANKIQLVFSLMVPVIIIILTTSAGVFNQRSYYRDISDQRAEGVKCLIKESQNGGAIQCPGLYPRDLRVALANARLFSASFVRTIPFLPIPLEEAKPTPLFRLSSKIMQSVAMNNIVRLLAPLHKPYKLEATNDDPMLFFTMTSRDEMKRCTSLEVGISIKVSKSGVAQLFFLTPGNHNFTEAASKKITVQPSNAFEKIYFNLTSPIGFGDQLRFDPTTIPQYFELKDFVARCRS